LKDSAKAQVQAGRDVTATTEINIEYDGTSVAATEIKIDNAGTSMSNYCS